MATRPPRYIEPEQKAAPKPATGKPALVTAPSPTILTREVVRRIATCPVTQNEIGDLCAWNDRAKPTLHTTKASAEVESSKHIRAAHAELLTRDVRATKKRQVVNETLELAE